MTPGEKPETVKTHLRDMIIVPEMIGSMVGVYNGKVFNNVEIKVCFHAVDQRPAYSVLLGWWLLGGLGGWVTG